MPTDPLQLDDIASRADVVGIVTRFYEQAFADELLGPVFVDIAQLDLTAHLPQITDFWETILLGAQSYRGGAFFPHAMLHRKVPLTQQHFDRWLELWSGTVRSLHAGPRAEAAIAHAQRVAAAFHGRLWHQAPEKLHGLHGGHT